MERLNVGFIGCGRIADVHAPGYADSDQARIYAVCDSDAATAKRRAAEWGAERWYTDHRALLDDPRVDAVEILTPQKLHLPMVCDAAQAGKHIALQKPMTIDLSSADAMLAAVERAGIVFKVTDNYLFYPPIRRAKELIDEGLIGTPSNLRIKLISGGSGGWEVPAQTWTWRLAEAAAGRGLQTFDHGHHLWATAYHLLGDLERITAWIDYTDGVIDSPATIMWKYRSGAVYGMCEYCHASQLHIPSKYYANDEWIEITGSAGILCIERCTGNIKSGPALRHFDGQKWHDYDIESDWGAGFRGATQNFIAAIRGDAAPLLTGQQARSVLGIALAIGRSNELRREVDLAELDAPSPTLYALKKRGAQLVRSRAVQRLVAWTGFGADDAKYAAAAREQTLALADRFAAMAVPGWDTVIGLELLPEGAVTERMSFVLTITAGRAVLVEGEVPDTAELVLRIPAGSWGAILAGKKRIETAVIQRKLELDGKAELGLKLRKAFGL